MISIFQQILLISPTVEKSSLPITWCVYTLDWIVFIFAFTYTRSHMTWLFYCIYHFKGWTLHALGFSMWLNQKSVDFRTHIRAIHTKIMISFICSTFFPSTFNDGNNGTNDKSSTVILVPKIHANHCVFTLATNETNTVDVAYAIHWSLFQIFFYGGYF